MHRWSVLMFVFVFFLNESCPCSQLQTSPEYGQGMNPISRLAQIQQAKKEKEPEYTLVTERGLPRRREFVMQVLHQRENCSLTQRFYNSSVHNLCEGHALLLPTIFSYNLQNCLSEMFPEKVMSPPPPIAFCFSSHSGVSCRSECRGNGT